MASASSLVQLQRNATNNTTKFLSKSPLQAKLPNDTTSSVVPMVPKEDRYSIWFNPRGPDTVHGWWITPRKSVSWPFPGGAAAPPRGAAAFHPGGTTETPPASGWLRVSPPALPAKKDVMATMNLKYTLPHSVPRSNPGDGKPRYKLVFDLEVLLAGKGQAEGVLIDGTNAKKTRAAEGRIKQIADRVLQDIEEYKVGHQSTLGDRDVGVGDVIV